MAVNTYLAATATAPGCTITNVKSVTVEDTVQQLEIYADGAAEPTIFPWGRKIILTIEASLVTGAAGSVGSCGFTSAARAGSLPAAGAVAAPSLTETGLVTNVRASLPQVDGGMSSGTVVVVCTAPLP